MTTHNDHQRSGPITSLVALVLRVALGALFIYAAWQKLGPDTVYDIAGDGSHLVVGKSPASDFAASVHAYRIVPDHMVPTLAYVIPWAELLCGVLLVAGLWTRAASTVLLVSLAVFLYGIVMVLQRGMKLECGCFGRFSWPCGRSGQPAVISECHVVRNLVLMVPCIVLMVLGGGVASYDALLRWARRHDERGGSSTATSQARAFADVSASPTTVPSPRSRSWAADQAERASR